MYSDIHCITAAQWYVAEMHINLNSLIWATTHFRSTCFALVYLIEAIRWKLNIVLFCFTNETTSDRYYFSQDAVSPQNFRFVCSYDLPLILIAFSSIQTSALFIYPWCCFVSLSIWRERSAPSQSSRESCWFLHFPELSTIKSTVFIPMLEQAEFLSMGYNIFLFLVRSYLIALSDIKLWLSPKKHR